MKKKLGLLLILGNSSGKFHKSNIIIDYLHLLLNFETLAIFLCELININVLCENFIYKYFFTFSFNKFSFIVCSLPKILFKSILEVQTFVHLYSFE